jgi:hypothetical protein
MKVMMRRKVLKEIPLGYMTTACSRSSSNPTSDFQSLRQVGESRNKSLPHSEGISKEVVYYLGRKLLPCVAYSPDPFGLSFILPNSPAPYSRPNILRA